MNIKVYEKYIIKNYLNIILQVSLIFFTLIFILNIFEEINFFKDLDQSILYPFILTLLNSPSVLYDIFPFIFLIATQFFFIKINDKNELIIFKNNGINNFKILRLLVYITVIIALFINTVFYFVSSNLKYSYLDLKNEYSKDNKYLAVITENGLWIKDEYNKITNIINSEKIVGDELIDVEITQFNDEFQLDRIIFAEKINIKENNWTIKNPKISKNNFNYVSDEKIILKTNFNSKKLNSLFGNLNSLTFFELLDMKKNYKKLGYSTVEVEVHIQKFYTYPFYLTIMTLLSAIIMFNIRQDKPIIFHLILGIFLSVLIYYINFFSNVLGESLELSSIVSVIMPLLIITLSCSVGLVKLNEK
tara:strand:+ start:518 stop:1600 length:1083 start_codon:yes stop_codon:yes gene_type:complete